MMMMMLVMLSATQRGMHVGGSAPPRASPPFGFASVSARSTVRETIRFRASARETRVDAVKNLEHNLVSIQQSCLACYLAELHIEVKG